MKTIIALFLSLLFIALSGVFVSLTIETIVAASQSYIGQHTNEVYNFRLVLLVSAFLLTVLAIASAITALALITVFYHNYLRILDRKRDKDIKRRLLNNKYDKLYEELNNTNLYEEKEKIVEEFYNSTQIKGIKDMMVDILKDIKKKERVSNAPKPFGSPIID